MDKIRGLRPKAGGIEIRATFKGREISHFYNKPWNKTNCAHASRLRKQLIDEAKAAASDDHLVKDNPTFLIVAQDYLDSLRKRCTESHVDKAKQTINYRWLSHLGDKRIKDITIRDVRLADQDQDWSSAKRQQNCRSILRGVFDLAISDEYIDSNPAEKLKKVSHQRAGIDPFTYDEREAILKKLTGQSALYFLLAFETGMRTAELMALKWADLSNGEVTLTRTMVRGKYKEMKTKKIRDVALSKRAIEALDAVTVRTFEGHLWVNTQGEVLRDQIQLNKEWHAAIDDARVKMKPIRHRRPYNCRHTRASLGLSAGQTPGWLADQLGHDLRTFFTRYAKYMGGNNNAAELAKMGD